MEVQAVQEVTNILQVDTSAGMTTLTKSSFQNTASTVEELVKPEDLLNGIRDFYVPSSDFDKMYPEIVSNDKNIVHVYNSSGKLFFRLHRLF